MGALARDNLYNQGGGLGGGTANNSYYSGSNSPVNSSSYSGIASSSKTSNTTTLSTQAVTSVPSASGSTIGRVITSNGQTLTQATPLALVSEASQKLASGGSGDNTDYKYYSDTERQALSDELKQMVSQAEQFQRFAEQQQEKASQLQEDLKANEDSVDYTEGQSLPLVLSNNAKSLTTSINSLTSSVNEQFSLLNNNMMGMLIYFEQFLSNQVLGVTSASKIPEAITSSKTDYLKFVDSFKDIKRSIDNLKLSPSVSVSAPQVDVSVSVEPLAKSFDSINLSLDKLVKDETFKSLIDVQKTSKDNAKEFFDKKSEEADLQIESLQYDKNPQEVKDLDGQTVGTFAPREASLVKDATFAKNQTDEKNFELDDDDLDIATPIDISSIYGYEKSSDIIEQFILKMGGTVS